MKFIGGTLVLVFCLASQGTAQTTKTVYPSMAPLEQYLIADRSAEISLARSAAPDSVSRDAEVLVFTRHGYETAVKGTNGFVCMVARSWSAGFDDPEFWNPKVRAPICYNELAARSQVPATIKRTQIVLAGGPRAQVFNGIKAAYASGELPVPELGSMSYMLSADTYFGDRDRHWRPHLMFFTPATTSPKSWGAGLPNSPILGIELPGEQQTVFLIPVGKWSNGTLAPPEKH